MFDDKSRYRDAPEYTVTDRRGRTVAVVSVPEARAQTELGVHLLSEGQRLDHLAQKYLADAAGFWRICDLNDAMWPDALGGRSSMFAAKAGDPTASPAPATAAEVRIPRKA